MYLVIIKNKEISFEMLKLFLKRCEESVLEKKYQFQSVYEKTICIRLFIGKESLTQDLNTK